MAQRFLITGGAAKIWTNADTSIWSASSGGATGASVPGAGDDVVMDGSSGAGSVTLNYQPTVNTITMGAYTGTFNDGGFGANVSGSFSCNGTATRTLTISGPWTCGINWDLGTVTGLTLNAAGSTVTMTGNAAIMNVVTKTMGNVVFTGSGANSVLNLVATSLTYNAPASQGNAIAWGALTLVNLTLSGASQSQRLRCGTTIVTSQRTVTISGSFTLSNIDIRNTIAAGAAGTWSGTSIGDGGGNSNITFTSPVTRYWIGDTGNFSDTSHWATSTGGTSGATMPIPQDTANFDANSFSGVGKTVSFDIQDYANIDFSLATNSPTANMNLLNTAYYGSVTWISAMSITTSASFTLTFSPNGSKTFTSANISILAPFTLAPCSSSSTLTLGSDLTFGNNRTFTHSSGTFTMNGFNFTLPIYSSGGTVTRVWNMGSGTFTMTRTGTTTVFAIAGSGMTVNAGTSTFVYSANVLASNTVTFNFFGTTFNNIVINAGNANPALPGIVAINQAFTCANLTINNTTATVQFTNAITYTGTGTIQLNGTPGSLLTLKSDSNGLPWTLSKSSGYVNAQYVSLQDSTATGGATFNANLSTNVSGNTGWNFVSTGYISNVSSMTGVSSITF